jgi:WD40 repeat protein
MLNTTNLLAVVGNSDKWPAHKVLLWDDATRRCAGELNFKSDVKAVRLLRGLILVVLAHKVYVYDFSELRCVDGIETLANPKGLCALSTAEGGTAVLACPGLNKGGVRVEWFAAQPVSGSSLPRIVKDPARRTRFLTAHDSPLAALALTSSGERLATASEKGTLVRVFSTQSGAQIWELRRGLETHSTCLGSPLHDAGGGIP